ncbi:MAG: gamma-glutamyl-gamma-aminobutyrate hydrolase family protein [Xanthomonadaceae bacterium]|nr:gamma-glutamyl-gamma-aminobutyrate hydrolase family protein [Xanthomonadaceae bacterium]
MSRLQPRPVIGVTGPDHGGLAAWWFTALAVRRGGGKPVRIRPRKPASIDQLDGLILGGGADVSPALYGQDRHLQMREQANRGVFGWRRLLGDLLFPLLWVIRRVLTKKHGGIDADRDRLEKRLIIDALKQRLPMLGICRGMQLINVAMGGSLHQSLEGFYEEHPQIRSVLPRKEVLLKPGSRLERILGCSRCQVNALHNQAIDRLGPGLVGVAHEPNGILQGFEAGDRRWLVGVQWHPEYLPQYPTQCALFHALVRRAAQTVNA